MATLAEALTTSTDGYVPMEKPLLQGGAPPIDAQPGYSPMLRCPLPPTSADTDSLRQFYKGGQVPQMRVLPPPSLTTTVSGTVIEKIIASGTSSNSSSTVSAIVAKTASLTTPSLNPNQQYGGAMTVSRSFQLLSITANLACRIRLYGTAAAQSQDLGRALDFPPALGTIQNLISDVALDTGPFQWVYQNRIGANGNSPQTQQIYVTVTQLSAGSGVITLTLNYIPLEA